MFGFTCYKGHALRKWFGDTPTAVCPECGSLRIGARLDDAPSSLPPSSQPLPGSQGSAPRFVSESEVQVLEEFDVLTRDEDDGSGDFDSVRDPEPPPLYAFIDEIQVTEGREGTFYELAFVTIDASWFDSLPDTLEGMTPEVWSRSARESRPARLELVTSERRLQEIIDRSGGEVSFHAGNWVGLRVSEYDPETFEGDNGLPVTVFLPTGERVASIGLLGPVPGSYLVTVIERIRPTSSGLRKLRRFKQAISLEQ